MASRRPLHYQEVRKNNASFPFMKMPNLVSIAAAFCVMASAVLAEGDVQTPVQDRPVLDLIGSVEGPDGYDDVTLATSLQPDKPITKMTIGEVLAFQDRIIASGANSSAIGRYQFIRSTLAEMVEKMGLDENVIFDRRTQDYLARKKLVRCGFYERDMSDARVANCLARTWAALPIVSGPQRGLSHYHGRAGNSAKASVSEVLEAVSLRFDAPRVIPISTRN
jgi:hypothetical protein